MGLKSDLAKARQLFSDTRRALMYTPMDAVNKSIADLDADCARISRDLGPCDLVVADLDAGTADSRVIHLANIGKLFERLAAQSARLPVRKP